MKKGFFTLILLMVLSLLLAVPSLATENTSRLVDNAELLSNNECLALEQKLDELSQKHELDIVIVTVDSIGSKTPQQFADDFFDYGIYGQGPNRDGILFLVSMEERDWSISTSGYAITAFTDAGMEYIEDQVVPYLSDGDYETAFSEFADLCDQFIEKARSGAPYDRYNLPKGDFDWMFSIILAVVIALVVALIVTAILKAQLKSVRFQSGAGSYVKSGSMNITTSRDIFLYKNVTRREKPKNTGGSSSTHRSSSGRSHGGRSGKF